jgi:hypothetical protein
VNWNSLVVPRTGRLVLRAVRPLRGPQPDARHTQNSEYQHRHPGDAVSITAQLHVGSLAAHFIGAQGALRYRSAEVSTPSLPMKMAETPEWSA